MRSGFAILIRNHRRLIRKVARRVGWAQQTVAGLFFLIGATVFFLSYMAFNRAFQIIIYEPYAGPVIARYVIESTFHAVFLLGIASFVMGALSSLFRSWEVRMLMAFPVRPVDLFLYRFVLLAAWSAWPVALFGVPAILALGWALKGGAAFYLSSFLTLVLFLLAIAVIGSVITIVVAPALRRLGRFMRWVVGTAALFAFITALVRMVVSREYFGSFFDVNSAEEASAAVDLLRQRFSASPSHAFSDMIGSMLPYSGDIGMTSSVIVTGGLLLAGFLLLLYAVHRWYLVMLQLHAEEGFIARPDEFGPESPHHAQFPSLLTKGHGFLFEKDLLMFMRDPVEVSRAISFVVLLVLYIFAARVIGTIEVFTDVGHRASLIVFAFAAIGYFVLLFGLRFAFPALSLEGKGAWALWSSPVHAHEFFSWKLFFWASGVGTLMGIMAFVTALLFGLPGSLALFLVISALLTTGTIMAVTLGQGMIYPDFDAGDADTLTTSPAGLAATAIAGGYLFVMGRYIREYAVSALTDGTMRLDALFGMLIVSVSLIGLYWVLGTRAAERLEIPN